MARLPEERFESAEEMRQAFLSAIAPIIPADAREVAAVMATLAPPGA